MCFLTGPFGLGARAIVNHISSVRGPMKGITNRGVWRQVDGKRASLIRGPGPTSFGGTPSRSSGLVLDSGPSGIRRRIAVENPRRQLAFHLSVWRNSLTVTLAMLNNGRGFPSPEEESGKLRLYTVL